MNSRSPKTIEFRSKLGFNQYDITLKEKRIISIFTEVDERGHEDSSIDYEIKREKTIEKELDCEFIRTDPNEENFNNQIKN